LVVDGAGNLFISDQHNNRVRRVTFGSKPVISTVVGDGSAAYKGDGETPAAAILNGRDALKSALRTLREFGDPIPQPGSISASSGQWRQRVPKSFHARLVARAAREGVSLNMLVTALLAEGLVGRRERTK
jgi:antitoxin HicB